MAISSSAGSRQALKAGLKATLLSLQDKCSLQLSVVCFKVQNSGMICSIGPTLGSFLPSLEVNCQMAWKWPIHRNPTKKSKMEEAIRQNDTKKLQSLIDSGYYVNKRLDKAGLTGLHIAAERGYHQCVEILLSTGADPDMCTYNNVTPLQLAISNVQVRNVELLLQASDRDILRQRHLNLKEVLQMLLSPVKSYTRQRAQEVLTLVLTATPNLQRCSVFQQNQLFAIYRDFFLFSCLKAWLVAGNVFTDYQKKLLNSKFKNRKEQLEELQKFSCIPRTLKDCCRLTIRRTFDGRCNVFHGVTQLPLPSALKEYLTIPVKSPEITDT